MVNEAVLDLTVGDFVEVFGKLSQVPSPQNPGAFDWQGYFRQQEFSPACIVISGKM